MIIPKHSPGGSEAASLWLLACDQLPHDHSKAVHIYQLATAGACEQLWGCPGKCADKAGVGQMRLAQDPRQAHICNLGRAIRAQQDVWALQVEVDDPGAAAVHVDQAASHVERDVMTPAPHAVCQ